MAEIADARYSFIHNTLFGPTRYEGEYRGGCREGLWRVTNELTGAPMWETTWRNGVWHGPATGWWANGNLRDQGEYREGLNHGHWRFWFEDGTLAAEGRYEAGKKVGAWNYWDEAGNPMSYDDWAEQYEQWDWAYDDLTGFPHGSNWPEPPTHP